MEKMLFELKPFIGLFLLAWLWVSFNPIQNPIKAIFKGKTVVGLWLLNLLTCWRCVTLWAGLWWFGLEMWFPVLATCFAATIVEIIITRWEKI